MSSDSVCSSAGKLLEIDAVLELTVKSPELTYYFQ